VVAFLPRGAQMETVLFPAGTELGSLPVDGTPCVFRTTQDVEAVPVVLQNAGLSTEVGMPPRLSFDFVSAGVDVSQLAISKLRLFLAGGYSEAAKVMLLLCKYVLTVRLECGTQVIELGAGCLRASGFDNALLDYPGNAFPGYRVLQEFYVQPEKFLFVDIEGLERLRGCGKNNRFRIVCQLSQVPSWMSEIKTGDFMLNVTPVINLFSRSAEPISHEHRVSEYRVVPEAQEREHYRVFSVDQVIGYQQGVAQQRPYLPFNSYLRRFPFH
jgi:type VI secretion system protein ImpG